MDSILQLAAYIKAAKRIAFFSGAGISTESNLPDFRSRNGLWTNNQSFEKLVSLSYFERHPVDFWKAYKDIFAMKLLNQYEPNRGHLFITELQNSGRDVTVITQNIDGLHEKAGTHKVYEVHGTLKTATCPKCGTKYDLEYINTHETPRCQTKSSNDTRCHTILKPDVVLFGDSVHHFNESVEAAYESDLFIVMGSSLEVGPINSIPQLISGTAIPMVLINKEHTVYDHLFDLCLYAGIGETVEQVKRAL
ncbi:NAD-dependent protein deacylase [Peribacillus deserti]|uniref:protein acetyllysine N-acetyltransferase n=1 Tax=Peribacillus deserti TaxID=673318 RepID=A0A2N5M2D8_9BACI|nr:NAD-dependent protein deacylase [Peribacillus deserti]PLT28544.1 NAD-dependent protein deacylase [Peribacillus deserti]